MHAELLQLYPTLFGSLGCSPPGSSIHGVFQARIPEWAAICFFRRPSRHRDCTSVSCTGRQSLYHWPPGKPPPLWSLLKFHHHVYLQVGASLNSWLILFSLTSALAITGWLGLWVQSGQWMEWFNSEERETRDCWMVMEELGEREDVNLTHLAEQFTVKSSSEEISIQVFCPPFKSD